MDGECQLHNDIKNKFERNDDGAYRRTGEELVLGQVDFINCLPINLPIELDEVKINTTLVKGVPSELNKLILNNEIDIAPISSLTYLENKEKLLPIADLCIASNGPADSVLLFSKFPIEELGGVNIALSHASATSNRLLEIIFKEFLKITATFTVEALHATPLQQSNKYPAYLLIGDHALHEYSKMPRDIFIYDLGSLWKKHTGLPMVFGIWVARKEIVKTVHKLPLTEQLHRAKEIGLGPMFEKVIKKAQEKILLSKEFYSTYFQHLSYDYTKEYKKGLELFEKHCKLKERVTN